MKCPFCSNQETKVVDSRETADFSETRRRRECEKCGKRFTTYEKIESSPLFVVKKDGRREQFNLGKVKLGLMRACEKRPVSAEQINEILKDLEQKVVNFDGEISTREIGEFVMKKLKNLDKVAYIRFASVYRDFHDIKDFEKEIVMIAKDKSRK